jgi:hypothetical protein
LSREPSGIGWQQAATDGTLLAAALSPTVQGAIDGKAEAGGGVTYTPRHTRVRLRIEPELAFRGIHQWT